MIDLPTKQAWMNTSLAHLPAIKQEQLQRIASIITETANPEMVILFGSHATGRWVEHRYVEDGIFYEYISDYDILVITQRGDNRRDYEIQDVIENRCRFKTPVTTIVHDIDFVNKMLREGQYFFTDIEKEGILLYDSGRATLAERKPLSPKEAQVIAQEYYDQWFKEGQVFLKTARFNLQENDLKVGAFVLHQAAERTYNAVVLVFTGYKPKTHNLDKLKRYTKRFSEELTAVFPENTKEEEKLFDLLKRAYIDARYKKDFHITTEELRVLVERMQKLQDIAGALCLEKIEEIGGISESV